jgi:hypothetical protein
VNCVVPNRNSHTVQKIEEIKFMMMKLRCTAIALALVIGGVATAKAQTETVYNSIPNPIPGNVASEGPEAYAFSQLGDGLMLAGPAGRKLDKVTVVLSSWACQTGNWYTGTCVTTPGATFTLPITVNVYSVVTAGTSLEGASPAPAVGTLLATITQDFAVPYRPSANKVNCSGGTWYDKKAETCYNGLAAPITFDLSSVDVTLPSQIIVGVEFNSSDYGPHPLGDSTSCHATTEGCFYDSLNISTDSNSGFYQAIGSVLDVDGIFFNYTLPNASCTGSAIIGEFGLDAGPGCWTGYHPEIQVTAVKKQNEKSYNHGNWHNGKGGFVF